MKYKIKISNIFGILSYLFLFLASFMLGASEKIIEVEGLTNLRFNFIMAIIWFITMIIFKNKCRKMEKEEIKNETN